MGVLFGREERIGAFPDSSESAAALMSHLDPVRRTALLDHPREEIRGRAQQVLAIAEVTRHEEVTPEYRFILEADGDASRGAGVFDRECATCQRPGGHEVGPDLTERAAFRREELLVDFLDANRTVQSTFVNYRLDAADGSVLTGILAREAASSVTLRRGEGIEDVVARSDISSLTSMGLSLMPDELEDEVGLAEMADLLSFVQSQARQRRQSAPGRIGGAYMQAGNDIDLRPKHAGRPVKRTVPADTLVSAWLG